MAELLWAVLVISILGNAVVDGTDSFCAIALRPALAQVSDREMSNVIGQVHRFADQRMPVPGGVGLISALLATGLVLAGQAPRRSHLGTRPQIYHAVPAILQFTCGGGQLAIHHSGGEPLVDWRAHPQIKHGPHRQSHHRALRPHRQLAGQCGALILAR